jgi:hypothetical protein
MSAFEAVNNGEQCVFHWRLLNAILSGMRRGLGGQCGMQYRKPVPIGMRVMHQIVRSGGDTVPLGGIAEARDCFRCITQIGP